MPSSKLHLDVETYSEIDLRESGAFRYAEDPSTEVLIMAWAIGNEEPVAIDMTQADAYERLSPYLNRIVRGAIVAAHNVSFERVIWEKVLRRKYPKLPQPRDWDCTAARARMIAIPGSLDGAAHALGVVNRKDPRGDELIKLFSKPQRNGERVFPHERPDDFKAFIEYCRQDVRVEQNLDRILPPLTSVEKEAFALDYKINDAGMPVNLSRVRKADAFVGEYSEQLMKRSVEIAGCRPTQRERTLEFLESRGHPLPNLQAPTVEALAVQPGLDPDLVELLDNRIELSRAGTKKLKAIKACVSEDGRVRGGFMFSAASTRRWSSVGVQMHNLQKPEGEANPQVALSLLDDNPQDLCLMFGRPLTVLAQSIRGFFESPEHFLVADYASVEPRGLGWAAGEDWLTEAYRNKQDAYKIAAGRVYGVHADQVNPDQRFMGKQLVLGCFGPETLVLAESGWKRIVDIELDERLWDGVEFVSHQGVIAQGEKEVLDLCGVLTTPDHKIWTGQQFHPAEQIMAPGERNLLKSALASVSLPWKPTGLDQPAASGSTNADAPVANRLLSPRETWKTGNLKAANFADRNERSKLGGRTMFQNPLSRLGNSSRKSTRKLAAFLETCITGWSKNGLAGPISTKSTVSRFASGGNRSTTSLRTLLGFPAGAPNPFSIGRTTSDTMNPPTAGLSRSQSPTATRAEVFDILNAGPRHRFTILTDAGPMIVSNCGYGMGPPKFAATCARFGRFLTDEEASEAVAGYRASVPNIVRFWRQVENACIKAIRRGAPVKLGRFTFRPETLANGFRVLFVDMPSGSIAYPKPFIGEDETPWGETRATFNFWTPWKSSWVKTDTFGGSLVENIIQALTRDILRDGMLAADKVGFKLVGHCHDEAIGEGANNQNDLDEFQRLLCGSSEWAEGFPIATEGFISKVYRK